MGIKKGRSPSREVLSEEQRHISTGGRPRSVREMLLKVAYDRWARYEKAKQKLEDEESQATAGIPSPKLALAQADYDLATKVLVVAAESAASYYHPKLAAVQAHIEHEHSFVLRVPEQSSDAQEWLKEVGAADSETVN